jgi:hypothetical protein
MVEPTYKLDDARWTCNVNATVLHSTSDDTTEHSVPKSRFRSNPNDGWKSVQHATHWQIFRKDSDATIQTVLQVTTLCNLVVIARILEEPAAPIFWVEVKLWCTLYREGSQWECRTGKALKGTLPKEGQGQVSRSAHLSLKRRPFLEPFLFLLATLLIYNLSTSSCCHFYPEDGGRRYLQKLVTTYKTTRCHKPEDNLKRYNTYPWVLATLIHKYISMDFAQQLLA